MKGLVTTPIQMENNVNRELNLSLWWPQLFDRWLLKINIKIVLLDLEKLGNLDNCLLKDAINAGFLEQISLSLESMN